MGDGAPPLLQQLRGGAAAHDPPLFDEDYPLRETRYLLSAVSYINYRNTEQRRYPFDIPHEILPERVVKRGERLVHDDKILRGEYRAGERRALALPAGERGGASPEQVVDAEDLCDLGDVAAGRPASGEAAKGEVFEDVHVRKEPVLLKQKSNAASLGREINARVAVKKDLFIKRYPPAVRCAESGEYLRERTLAGSRRSEYRSDARDVNIKYDLKRKPVQPFCDIDMKHYEAPYNAT